MHKASILLTLLNIIPVLGVRNEAFLQFMDVSVDIHDSASIDLIDPNLNSVMDEDDPKENKMSFRNEAGPFFLSPRELQELLLDYQDVETEKQENNNNMKSIYKKKGFSRAKEEEGMSKLFLDSTILILIIYSFGGMLLFLIGAILYHAINRTKNSEIILV